MRIGIVGLGKMGGAIAPRLVAGGHDVFAYDRNTHNMQQASENGVITVDNALALLDHVSIILLMIPAGKSIDETIAALKDKLKKDTIIIDGGNSFYKDSMRRMQELKDIGVHYLDCGISGGVHGREYGYCLMVGGKKDVYNHTLPLLKTIASKDGVAYVGSSGAGHYVKMIHNGIEYGLLQAYAEGFHLLHDGAFDGLDLYQIAQLWDTSSIIRSFLLELAINVYEKDQDFDNIIGYIAEGGTGKWAVEIAKEYKVPIEVISQTLQTRAKSRKTGGNYATKLIALLRNQFGGHEVKKK
jgi:6-phosphogluconate dehydrogenase